MSVGCGQSADPLRPFLGEADAGLQLAAPAGAPAAAKTLADAPPSLRAAVIATQQRGAGPSFAAHEQAGQLVAQAQGFAVRYDELGAHLVRGDAEHGALELEKMGCADRLEAAAHSAPSFENNRVTYGRHAAGVAVDEWYVTGPMGLEQGFTIAARPACASGGAELVLEVVSDGLAVRAAGDALVLEGPSGERYRYSDLFAKDAAGKPLPARMELGAEGRIALTVNVASAAFPVEHCSRIDGMGEGVQSVVSCRKRLQRGLRITRNNDRV